MKAGRANLGRWALRLVSLLFVAGVAVLVAQRVRAIDRDAVGEALSAYTVGTLATALALTALSYLLYGGYELIARAYVKHRLPRRRVAAIAFVIYAFNLNLSAWIGGLGFRFRLYGRNGLHAGTIARILGLGVATNWLGYTLLAGIAFTAGVLPIPDDWPVGQGLLRGIGVVLLALAAAYFTLVTRSRRRSFRLRGHEFLLPPPRLAIAQLAASSLNWLTIAAIVWVLLGRSVPYPTVLSVLMVASVAGVVAHIPAGLGVIEGVFLALLGTTVGEDRLLAALLCYRAIYYLLPLLGAIGAYLALEARGRGAPPAAALSARR